MVSRLATFPTCELRGRASRTPDANLACDLLKRRFGRLSRRPSHLPKIGVNAAPPASRPRPATPVHLIHRHLSKTSARPASEQVCLRAERRQFLKRRWRGVAEDGTEFGFDLETRLPEGAVIFQTDGHDYIVLQEPETVYVVHPANADEAALIGWKIGNLHLPVEIADGMVRVLHDPAVRQLCEREGWPLLEEMVLFKPLRVVPHAS